MRLILGQKGDGKTKECLLMSAQTGYYIVCADRHTASALAQWALDLNLKMPFPITFEDLRQGRFYSKGIKGFIIDNADQLLEDLCKGTYLHAVTMTSP